MKLNEGQINHADAKAVFKTAADLRNNNKSTGISRLFKGLKKDQINVNDLQQAWKDDGFPDDTRDLAVILKDHGFNKKEIDKVFTEVFGSNADEADPVASPAIQKIADYAKANGLADELKNFLQKEYGFTESYSYEGKAVVEDIRRVFSSIVQEERTDRTKLIREQEQTLFGRTKK